MATKKKTRRQRDVTRRGPTYTEKIDQLSKEFAGVKSAVNMLKDASKTPVGDVVAYLKARQQYEALRVHSMLASIRAITEEIDGSVEHGHFDCNLESKCTSMQRRMGDVKKWCCRFRDMDELIEVIDDENLDPKQFDDEEEEDEEEEEEEEDY